MGYRFLFILAFLKVTDLRGIRTCMRLVYTTILTNDVPTGVGHSHSSDPLSFH